MNPRQRILNALNHKPTDKVPIDFGGGRTTGINGFAYDNLVRYLKLEETTKIYDLFQFLALPSDKIKGLFKSDIIQINNLKPRFGIKIDRWKQMKIKNVVFDVPEGFNPEIDNLENLIIENGNYRAVFPKNSYYFDYVKVPFKNIKSLKDFESFFETWNIASEEELSFIEDHAKKIRENSDFATMWTFGGNIFELGYTLMDYQTFMEKILTDKKLIGYYLDKIMESHLENLKKYLPRIKDYIDIILLADDLGNNMGLQISPALYREVIKPRERQICKFIKENSPSYILLHSCGGISELIPDFIEIGVDALNPIQASAKGMDPILLKKEYGKYITFWGGGVDNSILSKGDLKQISNQVNERIEILSKNDGYVFSAIHNIQADVLPESVINTFATANKYKSLPL
jgi:uroporphyrinogen decarboxylase